MTVLTGTPVPVTETVAERLDVDVLAAVAVTVTPVPSEPAEGATDSHVASHVILHGIFEEISNFPFEPDSAPIDSELTDTFKYGALPVWVTITVWFDNPDTDVVTVAWRGAVPGLAEVAVTVIAAPFDPLTGDTVSHEPSSVIVHEVFEVMLNVPDDPEAEATVTDVAERFR